MTTIRKDNKVAHHLLAAFKNHDLGKARSLLQKYNGCSNTIIQEYGFAPIHYASGLENLQFAERFLQLILEHGGNPNVITTEGESPLLIAASWGHANIVKLLLSHGADLTIVDEDNESPISWAIKGNHFNVITIIKNHLFEQKILLQKSQNIKSEIVSKLKQSETDDKNFTPNKRNYNFDVASPYYVNITHRRKNRVPFLPESLNIKTNIFDLTEENLYEYSKNLSETGGNLSFIEKWRQKVLQKIGSNHGPPTDVEGCLFNDPDENKLQQLDDSFVTALDQLQINADQLVVLKTEDIEHTDAESSIRFYERKTTRSVIEARLDSSVNEAESTISTKVSIPLDYDTSVLREELTQIGDPPGPITSTTKNLYLKRLVKYKISGRAVRPDVVKDSRPKFSIELERTLKPDSNWQESIASYLKLEQQMVEQFLRSTQKFREGHLKISFIYLLLDPRVAQNLPGQTTICDDMTIWTQFLSSIFYIGKGKSSRPYSHLYDAIRFYQHQFTNGQMSFIEGIPLKDRCCQRMIGKPMSEKLHQIIDIWRSKKGVICVHVFHNIMPAEAYTREAAIIDAIGLQNLTNQKRGDYYGVVQTWSMRDKKQLGISLLYKAMKIFLTEGESQLLPSDLV